MSIVSSVEEVIAMNPQQVFEHCARHLFEQGLRSEKNEGWMCAYRGENGTCCPVGALIPDSLYDKKMEGADVSDLVRGSNGALRFTPLTYLGAHTDLLQVVQNVHDQLNNWQTSVRMRRALKHAGDDLRHDPIILIDTTFLAGLSFAGGR